MSLERWGILKAEKGKSSLLSESLVENSLRLTFKLKSKNDPSYVGLLFFFISSSGGYKSL